MFVALVVALGAVRACVASCIALGNYSMGRSWCFFQGRPCLYKWQDYQRHVPDLMPREVLHTYQIINYIAGVMQETIDHRILSAVFREKGFDLKAFAV